MNNIRRGQRLAILLSIIGAGGTVATAYLSRKAAAQELKQIGFTGEEEDIKLSKKDILKIYGPTLSVGTATIASIIGSSLLSRRTEASLLGMAVMADNGWRRYKHQVKRYLGNNEHVNVLKGMAKNESIPKEGTEERNDGRKLYFEEHIGFFLADPDKLALAYGDMNQRLHVVEKEVSAHYAMLYDLIEFADAIVLNQELDSEELLWGWSYDYLQDTMDYVWVHWFFHEDATPDGTPYTVIEWGEEPILNPGNYGEYWINMQGYHDDIDKFHAASKDIKNK